MEVQVKSNKHPGSAPDSRPHHLQPSRSFPRWCTVGKHREEDLREQGGSMLLHPSPSWTFGWPSSSGEWKHERAKLYFCSPPGTLPFQQAFPKHIVNLNLFTYVCSCFCLWVYVVLYTCVYVCLQRKEGIWSHDARVRGVWEMMWVMGSEVTFLGFISKWSERLSLASPSFRPSWAELSTKGTE